MGDVTITQVVEWSADHGMAGLIPDATPARVREIDWLQPDFANAAGELRFSVHAFAIETSTLKILVDTCIGNAKERADAVIWHRLDTEFLVRLDEIGFGREAVDIVLCTHLHLDHVGWNTMLIQNQWVPTFPCARYLFGAAEYDHLLSETNEAERLGDRQNTSLQRSNLEAHCDSIQPIFEANLATLVSMDHQICDEVRLVPTPGHTPGHVSVQVTSGGETAFITGDMAHHPCQLAHPEWAASADFDVPRAIETRRLVFEGLAESGSLVLGTHWSGRCGGHVQRSGMGFMLVAPSQAKSGEAAS